MPFFHVFSVLHRGCDRPKFNAYVVRENKRPFDDDVEVTCDCGQTFHAFVSSTKCLTQEPKELRLAKFTR